MLDEKVLQWLLRKGEIQTVISVRSKFGTADFFSTVADQLSTFAQVSVKRAWNPRELKGG